jgi:hypothetical protein
LLAYNEKSEVSFRRIMASKFAQQGQPALPDHLVIRAQLQAGEEYHRVLIFKPHQLDFLRSQGIKLVGHFLHMIICVQGVHGWLQSVSGFVSNGDEVKGGMVLAFVPTGNMGT